MKSRTSADSVEVKVADVAVDAQRVALAIAPGSAAGERLDPAALTRFELSAAGPDAPRSKHS